MVKVVVDTNVVISSAVSIDGNPALIFEMLLLEKIINYITQEIIDEVKEVIKRPRIAKKLSLVEQEFIIKNFENFSKKIKPIEKLDIIKDDPDDNKFLECAIAASAEYIISGDKHLLILKQFRDIKVVSPAEFVRIINKEKK